MTRWLAASLLVPLAACQAHLRAPAGLRALGDEAEVFVYLRPLPPEAERLSFEIAAVAAVTADGAEVPLQLRLSTVRRSQLAGERLLAAGRLPPGRYDGLAVRFAAASIGGEDGPAALLVSKEPSPVTLPWSADRGTTTVVAVSLGYAPSVERTFRFEPSLTALVPERPVPDAVALIANAGMASLTVADRRTRRVAAVLPTGGSPRAVAIDAAGRRLYVAVSDEDAVQVFDLASGAPPGRVRLAPGDRPWDLALAPDGRTLVVANAGSSTASFVDVANLAELQRVPTGEEPSSLLLDRGGRRAYVLDRRANAVTVLDVANRAVVTTVPTDPEPLHAALDAAGRRLYVVHAGSPYLTVLSLPDLAPAGRVFVGLGASTVLVDSHTDLVYVGRSDERRLQVFDPYSLAPVSFVDVPAPVGRMAIDDAENALWALLPEARAVAVLDLTTRETLAVLDVGDAPTALALTRARP
jgi:YVTN family beta-propeller protein